MQPDDLPAVAAVARMIHVDYPEDAAVFAERLHLHPAGCLVLASADAISGYVVSHPWRAGDPPALNTLLGAIPGRPNTYYIHDLALLPDRRGTGKAAELVTRLVAHAASLDLVALSLIAVGGSQPFWQRQGFAIESAPSVNLASYVGLTAYMVRPVEGSLKRSRSKLPSTCLTM